MATGHSTLPLKANSAWNREQVETFLRDHEEPLRISIEAAGAPLIIPLWFLYEDGLLWCASTANAYLSQLIAHQPNCGFDISGNHMPYCGVRGQGHATIEASGDVILGRLAERYLKDSRPQFKNWLLSRPAKEISIRIEPKWLTAWDFGARM